MQRKSRLPLTIQQIGKVAVLLGRKPRGLEDVPVAQENGQPMVIRVASLVEDKPFPTLFWLIDPVLCYRIDQAEANGLIKQLQQTIDESPELQQAMGEDHRAHIALRETFMGDPIKQRLQQLGFQEVLSGKGIGGIADFTRIRCLHTWYAAHLVVPNTVGALLDQWWQEQDSN
jgi:hypothetical protein